ncbi:hypothetical protein NBRC116495_08830 [Aurantivibrio plasticivorans]
MRKPIKKEVKPSSRIVVPIYFGDFGKVVPNKIAAPKLSGRAATKKTPNPSI